MRMHTLGNFNLANKTVLLRVDFNVPIQDKKVRDNSKIQSCLPTIKYLLEQQCRVVIGTHLGRPAGKSVSSLSVNPLVKELQDLLPKTSIKKLNDCFGKEIINNINKADQSSILFLENLRFHKAEEQNDATFAHCLAQLADVFVNDAFAVSHRENSSVCAITKFLPSLAGFLMQKEMENLSKALGPKKPSIWLLGGAKLDKVDLLDQALNKAEHVLIGGALPFPFLKAQGIPIGMSKSDVQAVIEAKKILKSRKAKKLIFPVDYIVSQKLSSRAPTFTVAHNQIQSDQIALDLGPESISLFQRYLRKAQTIVWNGPLGYYEWTPFANATREIGKYIGSLTATSICGGGETEEAIKKFHLEHNITHISTGGGAALTFLSGKPMPAILALKENYRKYQQ